MKRILCVGERYALFQTPFKPPTLLLAVLMMIWSYTALYGNSRTATTYQSQPTTTLTGTITDTLGQPIQGATIALKGTRLQTTTDSKGAFTLQSPLPSGIVTITHIGYIAKEQPFGEDRKGPFHWMLSPITNTLEEVEINAGYYTTTDRNRTGNIGRITAADIQKQPVSNPLLTLHGRIPGVIIQQQSGVPGTAVKIQIRGQNSLRADGNAPLYIIDGVPVSSDPTMAGLSGFLVNQGMDPLNGVNMDNIESIEILKDADATAIYGSRGANGVVLITTKSESLPKIDVSFGSNFSKVPRIQLLNREQYLEFRREAVINDNIVITPTSPTDLMLWDTTRYTDWQKVLLGNNALAVHSQISISGSSNRMSYRLHAGWNKQNMVFPGDMYNRQTNVGMRISHGSSQDRFRISLTANYTNGLNRTSPHDFVSDALRLPPVAPPLYTDDGEYNWQGGTWTNPLATLERHHLFTSNNLNANSNVDFRIFKDLFLRTNLGYTRSDTRLDQQQPIRSFNPLSTGVTGRSMKGENTLYSWIAEPQLFYEWKLNGLNINALIGATLQSNDTRYFRISGTGYTNDALLGNIRAASTINFNEDEIIKYKYLASFSRIAFKYLDRYFVNFTARFGNFGAIGLAWIVSDEPFMRFTKDMVSFLKLRGSYGSTGNDRIGDYGYLDSYSVSTYVNEMSLRPARHHNPLFSWEVNRKADVELETKWWDDRIGLGINWYKNTSSNQLVGYALPIATGFSSVQANLPAKVENKGWEFQAMYSPKPKRGVYYQISANFSLPKNRLVSYPDIESSTYANQYIVGKSLSVRRLFVAGGLSDEGLYTIKDIDGDGKYTITDRTYIVELGRKGYGGLFQTLSYKNWTLNIGLEGVIQSGMGGQMGLTGFIGSMQNKPVYVLKRWKRPGDQTNVQKAVISVPLHNSTFENMKLSDQNFVDASFLRMRNVHLGYKMPDHFIQRMGLTFLELSISGQNLLTWTGYDGWEVDRPANNSLPALRTINFGIRTSF
jgi:TonB-linked SusC/RagA family outer membrane protein